LHWPERHSSATTALSTDALRERAAAIAQRHGLGDQALARYASGSLPVFALGTQHVLKLYPPQDQAHATVEARVLAFVDGRLPLPTPQVVACGDTDEGHYLLMTQLRGRLLVEVWPQLATAERLRLCRHIGESVAALHALDSRPLADLPPPHWADFVPAQRLQAVERQRGRGLPEPWLEQIEPFVERWAGPADTEQVLLHTEIMREHLLVEPQGSGWRLSGLFDFEPSMRGARDYEFASIGLFVSGGDARALRCILRACGYADAELDGALPNRLMAMALLHRYSNLPWYLQRLPLPGATRLEQLAAHWWKLDIDEPPSRGHTHEL
jgi:hygromycin-B 7''-O-kinase